MAKTWREWEKPVIELEEVIQKLRAALPSASKEKALQIEHELARAESALKNYIRVKYSRLGAWERTLISRAEQRPYTRDYLNHIVADWIELQGDRRFGDDKAIIGGLGRICDTSCVIVGHQKGRDIQERKLRNFGMAKPEGYRKAIRLFDLAERTRLPIISFIDTPAADPGVESESRGISEAIAAGMFKMFSLTVPTVAIVIGEGGSGGAIGIGAANRVLMLEHSIYSVIPPEGCAAILWRNPESGPQAAAALKLTAQDALSMGLIDEVVEEAFGGAHRDPHQTARNVEEAIGRHLGELASMTPERLRRDRYDKYRRMGVFETGGDA